MLKVLTPRNSATSGRQESVLLRLRSLGVRRAIVLVALMLVGGSLARFGAQTAHAALYSDDRRQAMTEADVNRFAGAGVLMCYSDYGALEQAAYRKMSESRRSDWPAAPRGVWQLSQAVSASTR
jgi:hypothetical protein